MKLLVAGPSPFVRKVRVLIHETNQQSAIEEVNVVASPTGPDAELIAANPSGKIPALIRDDGPAIYDSRVICRFLDARVGSGLYPDARIWETLTLEASADALMDAAVLMVYEERFRKEGDMSHIAIGCALGYLDLRQPDNDWRGRHDGLARWFEVFDARPSMNDTRFSG